MADFLWKDIICRHGCFRKLIIDGGSENKNIVAELARKYRRKRVIMSAYHLRANGMIKCEHKSIIDALSKMSDDGSTNWVQNLLVVLWADWSTICISTGLTLYYICGGSESVFHIELEVPIWQILP